MTKARRAQTISRSISARSSSIVPLDTSSSRVAVVVRSTRSDRHVPATAVGASTAWKRIIEPSGLRKCPSQ